MVIDYNLLHCSMKIISIIAIVRKPLVAITDGCSTKAISADSHSRKAISADGCSMKNYDLQLHSFYVFSQHTYKVIIMTTKR